jgi:hypothetical protein
LPHFKIPDEGFAHVVIAGEWRPAERKWNYQKLELYECEIYDVPSGKHAMLCGGAKLVSAVDAAAKRYPNFSIKLRKAGKGAYYAFIGEPKSAIVQPTAPAENQPPEWAKAKIAQYIATYAQLKECAERDVRAIARRLSRDMRAEMQGTLDAEPEFVRYLPPDLARIAQEK